MQSAVTFLVVVSGIFGLLIGSFLNVVAYRVPAKITLMRESRCPHCDVVIKPWHNVPVIGWLALGGKCANCKRPISARYPIVEALTGLAFAVVTWWGLAVYAPSTNSGTGMGSGTGGGQTLATYLASPAWDGIVYPDDVWAYVLVIVAFLYFAAISIVLTLIDLDTHRLPNSIVLPSY
ncbi:MAG: prepilin peptidase, partial [Rhodococcus erythropolis]|nr:prepilin peptidase [Rhodococcus erythropolis]